jgi:hypothetical protein
MEDYSIHSYCKALPQNSHYHPFTTKPYPHNASPSLKDTLGYTSGKKMLASLSMLKKYYCLLSFHKSIEQPRKWGESLEDRH